MIRARHVSLALALVVLVALAIGTGGFSSATVERGVAIAVVNDEQAYLGIEVEDVDAWDGDEVVLLTLTNRFTTDLDEIAVTVGGGEDSTVTVTETPETIGVGDSASVLATVECDRRAKDETLTLHIEVSGGGVGVVTDAKTVTVNCIPGNGPPSSPPGRSNNPSSLNGTASNNNNSTSSTNNTTPRA